MSVLIFWPSGGASTEVAYEDDESGGQEHEPLTASAATLVDAWGYERYVESDDPAQDGPASSGTSLVTAITRGTLNGDFLQGPPDPAGHIDDSNPLPYWRYALSVGSSMYADWVVIAGSPGGYGVRFTIADAVSGDEAYIEQIIAVGDGPQFASVDTETPSGTDADLSYYVETQYLDATGVVVGSPTDDEVTFSTSTVRRPLTYTQPPAGSRYARVRVGVRASGAGSATVDFTSVSVHIPFLYHASLVFSDISTTQGSATSVSPAVTNASGSADNP